jgi:hypothetical protein
MRLLLPALAADAAQCERTGRNGSVAQELL